MGEVFLLRANITAVGSVLDSPHVFWVSVASQVRIIADESCPVVPGFTTALRRSAKLS